MPLAEAVAALAAKYGTPAPPRWTDPFELVILENASYLVDDGRRAEVFEALKEQIGTTPEAILAAPPAKLAGVIERGGMRPPMRAEKLHEAAKIALDMGLDRLRARMRSAPEQARRDLKKFPGIREPGADKLLLYYRAAPSLAPDSNALRVLTRLGFAEEGASYDRTYRAVKQAIAAQLPEGYDALIAAHQLLRTHGQETCKRTAPSCTACPLARGCAYFAASGAQTAGR